MPISRHDRKLLARYTPRMVSVDKIKPSPENAEIYGAVNFENDPALQALVRSIERRGLEEPLILTKDNFILSGHRRFFVVQELGWEKVPARYATITRADSADYHRLLSEYNPQRVKSVATILSEKMLAPVEDDDNGSESWAVYQKARSKVRVIKMQVAGEKPVEDTGIRQDEFLEAAQKVIQELRDYWPLSIRQIHYKLLNNPPLTQVTKNRNERWRYVNNQKCYKKLSDLLGPARYHGHVAWESIDDETRDSKTFSGFTSTSEFIEQETNRFLVGYNRDRQEGQPNHVELIVEKNTLLNVLGSIADQFYIPLTALRGYGGPSIWKEIELRWRAKVENHTGTVKPKCVLVIVSDHDPEGLDLAADAVRSLRDRHGVEIESTRPAITLEQAQQYALTPNPAKKKSTRYRKYVARTGTSSCWEVEALDPTVLRGIVLEAIKTAMDINQMNAVQECELQDKRDIQNVRLRISSKMREIIREGDE